MKAPIIQKCLFAAVVPAIILALLAGLLAGCAREATPRKEKVKTETPAALHKDEEKTEGHAIELSPEQVNIAGIEVQKVTLAAFKVPLSATAVIEPNNDRMSKVGSRVAGRITKITVTQGDRVKAGQPLAYLESVDLDQASSDYAKAKGRQALAAANLKREETLFEKKVAPEKDVLKARQEASEAEADLTLAAKRLRILGVEEGKTTGSSNGTKQNHPHIAIPSPLSGVVIEKTVTQGEMVNPEKVLFIVSDLSSLWAVIDVYEKDLSLLKTGMEVKLLVAAYPDRTFGGRVSYIGDVVDEKTRTVKARVTIENRGGFLKPGMFATVSMESAKDLQTAKMIVVPEEAVVRDGPEIYVFLRQGVGRFVVRPVSVGSVSNSTIEIRHGLKAGDTVVVKGVFELKSELKKESIHDDHGH
jgi:cobalt-zinc-cadmium efflux system membrane fusion protein